MKKIDRREREAARRKREELRRTYREEFDHQKKLFR